MKQRTKEQVEEVAWGVVVTAVVMAISYIIMGGLSG